MDNDNDATIPNLGDAAVAKLAQTRNNTIPARGIFPIGVGPSRLDRPAPKLLTALPMQEYAYSQSVGPKAAPDTLLWKPLVSSAGQAQISFDLPKTPGVYTVRVEGNSQTGRLGIAELTIDTRTKPE
jgi:hypothetical protein